LVYPYSLRSGHFVYRKMTMEIFKKRAPGFPGANLPVPYLLCIVRIL
jgi:hypothetical protein